MRSIIGILARADSGLDEEARRMVVSQAVRFARSHWRIAFPTRAAEIDLYEWISPDGTSAVLQWSNEPALQHAEAYSATSDRCVSVMGYTDRDIDLGRLGRTEDLLEMSTTLPGCFGVLRASGGVIEAVTDVTRSNNFFSAENHVVRVVGSRAVLVKAITASTGAKSEILRLDRDVAAIRYMANLGHFIFEYSPFNGVRAIGTSTLLRLTPQATTSRQLEPGPSDAQSIRGRSWRDRVDHTAEALVSAFDVIPPGDLTISLTGGRDSRILAAALRHRPDLTVSASTMGRPDDPDVVISKEIARLMGYPHSVRGPGGVVSDSRILAEDPCARIVRNLDIHDGMTSAWDDIVDYPAFDPTPAVSGVGGEILRGGLVWTHLAEMRRELTVTQLRNFLLGGPFFSADFNAFALENAEPILALAEHDHHEAADYYYRIHRNGRWVSARRTGARMTRPMFDPLLDNRLIRSVLAVSPKQRWNERLVFDVINALEPRLRDIPVEGNRWRFERIRPHADADANEAETWPRRHALARSDSTRRYSWQRLENPAVRERIVALILDGTEGGAGRLFDRAKLETYLAQDPYPYPTVVWHVATAVVMLTEPWYLTTRPPRQDSIEILI